MYLLYLLSIEIQKPLTASTKPLVFTKMGENSPKIDTIGNYYPQFGKADYGNTMAKLAQNLSAQIVCPSPKVWDFDENRLD